MSSVITRLFSRYFGIYKDWLVARLRKRLGLLLGFFFAVVSSTVVADVAPVRLDFGDAPTIELLDEVFGEGEFTGDGYPDAFHVIPDGESPNGPPNGPWLGIEYPDAEDNRQSSINFNGDDVVGIDDEDGIALDDNDDPVFNLGTNQQQSTVGSLELFVGNVGLQPKNGDPEIPVGPFLNAFIDFNADGDWNDDGETLVFSGANSTAGLPLGSGDNTVSFAIPDFGEEGSPLRYRAGLFGVRLRISSKGGLTAGDEGELGGARDGELEDHLLEIFPNISVGDISAIEGSGDSPSGTLVKVPVTIDRVSNQPIHFHVSTANGTVIPPKNNSV